MDIQTGEQNLIRAGNFTVAALQRRVFSHSYVTAFMVNKQLTGSVTDTSAAYLSQKAFNRVAGIEYNLATADNRWTGKAFYHQSFYPGAAGDAATVSANISYATQYTKFTLSQAWVGRDYLAEVGYIRRRGYYELSPTFQYKFFPSGSRIANHGPAVRFDILFDPAKKMTDRETQLLYSIEWLNRSILQADVKETFIKLQLPFDPTNKGTNQLAANSHYTWREFGTSFTSDVRKPFNFLLGTRYGGFYTGTKLTLSGELNYRIQPYGSIAIVSAYNDIDLPSPQNSAKYFLIGPKLDITFTDKLFFTSFVQYNNQIDNLNLNLRFQWRFAPVSDLFIVYTENSIPGNYTIKNRGLVFKVSYWFN
jgi:hypothetical protein